MYEETHNYLIASYPHRGLTFVSGDGMYLQTDTGERYLDLGSGYGVAIFGYKHKAITQTLKKQIDQIITVHGSFGSDVRTQAAKKLVDRCSGKLSQVFFSNSGAEAVEAALKFARLATKKSHFIAFDGSYHGKTLGALSATAGDKYRKDFQPLLWNFSHVPFGDIKALKKEITKETAAIIIEPIQGEGGIIVPPKDFLFDVKSLCQKRGVVLIVDEIQTGVGRTGTFLASEQFGLQPDILCLGKGLAGGVPVGATLVSEPIAKSIPMHVHTSTFGGNPLTCAGILAVLKEFENKNLLPHIKTTGAYFYKQLQTLKHPKIVAVRGNGLMLAIELKENATPILKALQQEKIIAIPAGSTCVRFLPPYLITKKEIDITIKVLKKAFLTYV